MLDTMRHRTDLDPAVADSKPHRSAEVASDGFPNEGHLVAVQHLPCGHQVTLAHLNRSRGRQGREHAGPAGQSGGEASWLGSVGSHELDQPRHRSLRELGWVAAHSAQRGRWKEDVRHASNPSFGIVEQDCDAATEAYGDQGVIGKPATEVRHPDNYLAAAHATRR
jgi:hypothetical protein